MQELRSLAKQKEADDYMLKWGGENDVKGYLSQMAEERRKSLQLRAKDAREARQHEEEEHAQAVQESLKDMVLKSECKSLCCVFVCNAAKSGWFDDIFHFFFD